MIKKLIDFILKLIPDSSSSTYKTHIDLSRIKCNYRLKGVDKRLLIILSEVSKHIPLLIPKYGGKRTIEQQKKLFDKGASKTLKSKHIKGLAVDPVPFYNNKIDWNATHDFAYMCGYIKAVAIQKGIGIRQGCKWDNKTIEETSFRDYPHTELI